MNSFLLALQLLTIIPVTHTFIASDKQLGYSCLFYPIIGLFIGTMLVALASLVTGISVNVQAAAVLMLWVLLTGGLHLDGLADCADAWVGGFGSKQRSLDIMKDPAAGPIAVVILVLVLLLKWTLISSILEQKSLYILVLTPMLGRLAILILMLSINYIRSAGMAEKLITHLPRSVASFFCLIGAGLGFAYLGLLSMSLMLIILCLIGYQAKKRLGGVTGDVYGAAVELVEVSILLGAIYE